MMKRINPFFKHYDTPHNTIPFDKIRISDYEEAILEGIKRDREELDEIINNPAKPTFENTIVVEHSEEKDLYYGLLDRVTDAFGNLLSAETNSKMDALAQKLTPILTQHDNDVMLNPKLFERVKYVHRHHRKLNAEEKMLLDNYYDAFVQSGALLNDDDKAKLRTLTEELSLLSLQFSQNLLKETNRFKLHITDKSQLDGLTETHIAAAANEAKERGKEGWIFTLDSPSYGPFMTFSTQRDLRKKMYLAYNKRCCGTNKTSNIEICKRIINLRRELAQLMGYKTYADYAMHNRMAGSVANVRKLMNQLIKAYKPAAKKEYEVIVAGIRESGNSAGKRGQRMKPASILCRVRAESMQCINQETRESLNPQIPKSPNPLPLQPWDFGFYSHKLQLKKFNIDSEMLRPYLQLENVIKGVFGLATTLYGITFKENKKIPVYHKDVKAYEVFDNDGSYLAVLYTDFYPRKGKQDGAWTSIFQGQWITNKGENVRPHVSLVMNFTKPLPEKPSLLTLDEVETFLHEFGHALHAIFANTKYESLSGTNVWWDFVELPSQFMENYAVEKKFLKTFAFHYQTGEPMPDKLINRIVRSRNFNVAYACMRQVSFCLLDLACHMQKEAFNGDLFEFERKAWEKAIIMPTADGTCMIPQFSHIMAGAYAAGYYSYKWAEVLDADAFSVFKKHGIFNKTIAQKFRDCILSKGGTAHPMTLYKNFKGSEPTIDALLERNGLKTR